jgi:hypothetical protein
MKLPGPAYVGSYNTQLYWYSRSWCCDNWNGQGSLGFHPEWVGKEYGYVQIPCTGDTEPYGLRWRNQYPGPRQTSLDQKGCSQQPKYHTYEWWDVARGNYPFHTSDTQLASSYSVIIHTRLIRGYCLHTTCTWDDSRSPKPGKTYFEYVEHSLGCQSGRRMHES